MLSTQIQPEIAYAWHGPSFLIVNMRGECGRDQVLSGFYFRETRYLRTLRLLLNGEPPWLCDIGQAAPDTIELTFNYPELEQFSGGGSGSSGDQVTHNEFGIPHRSVNIRVRYRMELTRLAIAVRVTNRAAARVALELAWQLGADYVGLDEAFAGQRQQDAPVCTTSEARRLQFTYTHAELPYATDIVGSGPGEWSTRTDQLAARVTLEPQHTAELALHVQALDYERQLDNDGIAHRERVLASWRKRRVRVEVPTNRMAERIIARAVDDVASFPLLEGEKDEWLATQAGMPLYPAFFGRDAVTATWQAGFIDRCEALDHVLTRLGRLQGTVIDDWRDEQPGRIIQQAVQSPLARLNKNPRGRYYGDFASPLMYVIAIAQLYAWTGEKARVAKHWDTARRILDWARTFGDLDGDGYLEYLTRSSDGQKNQGWKDSGDGIMYADGATVPTPIAACEVQGYWFAAQHLMAVLSWVMGDHTSAKALWTSAMELKARFNREWWMPEERCFALALGPDKRLVTSIASNVGHCLAAGIIDDEKLRPVVGRLFAPDMFSGWGIRTLSADHVSYNPLAYHLGSVWAVENATIAFGLRRFGFDQRALEIAEGLFDLARVYRDLRIPECVGGFPRGEDPFPGTYPRANTPQAWNQSGFPLLVQTMLGLQPVAPLNLLVIDPVLPDWMSEVIVHDLRVGGATATIRFHRDDDGKTHADVLAKRGTLRVVRQPPPESVTAGIVDRFTALVDGILPH